MTQFIIHVGPHKTGTTYLQETLAVLRGELLDRGIYLPSVWNAGPGLPSHIQLVWALRNGDLTLIRDQLQKIMDQHPRLVVISCEALSRLDKTHLLQLRQLLGQAPAQVIYHVRRWPERLPSLWQEEVKFGHAITLPEYLAKHLTGYETSELWDTAMLDRFAAVFGAANIRVVAYSHLIERNIDIAGHFLASFLEISGIALPVRGRPNQSLPIVDTELIRALNAIHARRGGEPSPALREWYLANKDGLVPDAVLRAMGDSMGTIHLDEALPPVDSAARDLLARYGASIVPPHALDGVHGPRVIDVPFIRQDYLLEPDVATTLDNIHDRYSRTRSPPEPATKGRTS